MTKFEPCKGATSDHAWRTIAVDIFEAKAPVGHHSFHVQGGTWNMQMWCTSEADAMAYASTKGWDLSTVHANNPKDITELQPEYFTRKRTQILELERIICEGNDFFFYKKPIGSLTNF